MIINTIKYVPYVDSWDGGKMEFLLKRERELEEEISAIRARIEERLKITTKGIQKYVGQVMSEWGSIHQRKFWEILKIDVLMDKSKDYLQWESTCFYNVYVMEATKTGRRKKSHRAKNIRDNFKEKGTMKGVKMMVFTPCDYWQLVSHSI